MKPNRVSILMATGHTYDVALTDGLRNNLTRLAEGFVLSTSFLQISPEEYINLTQVVSFELITTKSEARSGGHVLDYDAKQDIGWTPNQRGSVFTAEPDAVTRARLSNDKAPTEGGGDME